MLLIDNKHELFFVETMFILFSNFMSCNHILLLSIIYFLYFIFNIFGSILIIYNCSFCVQRTELLLWSNSIVATILIFYIQLIASLITWTDEHALHAINCRGLER